MWTTGQIISWAVFQLITVPLILRQQPMEEKFKHVVWAFQIIVGILLIISVFLWFKYIRNQTKRFKVVPEKPAKKGAMYYSMWTLFWLLLIFQMVQAVRLAYADGDDAYYVAVSTLAEESNTMYLKLPYTGGSTGLDTRHGLAPLPIWIAFLARVSGMRTVSVAHIAIPLVLIPMTYAIYYLIGEKICNKNQGEKLPLFMAFTGLLVLFGDYSLYTVEHFMIARSRQGKAALGNIILPMMIYLLLLILERIQENHKIGTMLWILLTSTIIAGCLCSTLGGFLSCLLIGVTGVCAAVCYRRFKILIPLAASCIPALGYTMLYLLLD